MKYIKLIRTMIDGLIHNLQLVMHHPYILPQPSMGFGDLCGSLDIDIRFGCLGWEKSESMRDMNQKLLFLFFFQFHGCQIGHFHS